MVLKVGRCCDHGAYSVRIRLYHKPRLTLIVVILVAINWRMSAVTNVAK